VSVSRRGSSQRAPAASWLSWGESLAVASRCARARLSGESHGRLGDGVLSSPGFFVFFPSLAGAHDHGFPLPKALDADARQSAVYGVPQVLAKRGVQVS